jgi:hypothetical protein
MRNVKSLAARLAAIPVVVASSVAMAQSSTPTTAVGLAQAVDLSDAKSAGLIIVGLMVAAGVVLWGARLVMSKFKPKI